VPLDTSLTNRAPLAAANLGFVSPRFGFPELNSPFPKPASYFLNPFKHLPGSSSVRRTPQPYPDRVDHPANTRAKWQLGSKRKTNLTGNRAGFELSTSRSVPQDAPSLRLIAVRVGSVKRRQSQVSLGKAPEINRPATRNLYSNWEPDWDTSFCKIRSYVSLYPYRADVPAKRIKGQLGSKCQTNLTENPTGFEFSTARSVSQNAPSLRLLADWVRTAKRHRVQVLLGKSFELNKPSALNLHLEPEREWDTSFCTMRCCRWVCSNRPISRMNASKGNWVRNAKPIRPDFALASNFRLPVPFRKIRRIFACRKLGFEAQIGISPDSRLVTPIKSTKHLV
jgi:hypothetical protein